MTQASGGEHVAGDVAQATKRLHRERQQDRRRREAVIRRGKVTP
jgi:hypothetical protein